MSIVHDVIKIKYVEEGYLPNYPYYLISDKEMIQAFLREDDGFFALNYQLESDNQELVDAYQLLQTEIAYHLNLYLDSDKMIPIPDWVYSYMIGSCISNTSKQSDRHDLLVAIGRDNTADEFNEAIHQDLYQISLAWLRKLPEDKRSHRPPTMFGEGHVVKSLRLMTGS